jgi:hypothetical protein
LKPRGVVWRDGGEGAIELHVRPTSRKPAGLKGAPAAPAAAGRDKVGRKSDPTRLSLAPA